MLVPAHWELLPLRASLELDRRIVNEARADGAADLILEIVAVAVEQEVAAEQEVVVEIGVAPALSPPRG